MTLLSTKVGIQEVDSPRRLMRHGDLSVAESCFQFLNFMWNSGGRTTAGGRTMRYF